MDDIDTILPEKRKKKYGRVYKKGYERRFKNVKKL